MLRHVCQAFVNPKVAQRNIDPERQVAQFDLGKLYKGTGIQFNAGLLQYRELVSRLPAAVSGTEKHWVKRVCKHAGSTIMFHYGQVLEVWRRRQ